MSDRTPLLILGLGNLLCTDDGVGADDPPGTLVRLEGEDVAPACWTAIPRA